MVTNSHSSLAVLNMNPRPTYQGPFPGQNQGSSFQHYFKCHCWDFEDLGRDAGKQLSVNLHRGWYLLFMLFYYYFLICYANSEWIRLWLWWSWTNSTVNSTWAFHVTLMSTWSLWPKAILKILNLEVPSSAALSLLVLPCLGCLFRIEGRHCHHWSGHPLTWRYQQCRYGKRSSTNKMTSWPWFQKLDATCNITLESGQGWICQVSKVWSFVLWYFLSRLSMAFYFHKYRIKLYFIEAHSNGKHLIFWLWLLLKLI